MNILIDTNVALDVILKRDDFYLQANEIVELSRKKISNAFVSASAVTDMYYIANNALRDAALTLARIKDLLLAVEVATVSSYEIHRAIDLNWPDFEDCVQFTAGESLAVSYIVTRNPDDFFGSSITVMSPADFLKTITV